MADPRIKPLKIKTGVLKRVCKETLSYYKEAGQIQEKIKSMQEKGEDIYFIKKQDGLLEETNATIVDCQRRLDAAFADLSSLVESDKELEETEEYKAAMAVIEDSRAHITAK